MNTLQKKVKFSKGEVDERLLERQDINILDSSASYIKNLVSTPYGGVKIRAGQENIDTLVNGFDYASVDATTAEDKTRPTYHYIGDGRPTVTTTETETITDATSSCFINDGAYLVVAINKTIRVYTTSTAYSINSMTQFDSDIDLSSSIDDISEIRIFENIITAKQHGLFALDGEKIVKYNLNMHFDYNDNPAYLEITEIESYDIDGVSATNTAYTFNIIDSGSILVVMMYDTAVGDLKPIIYKVPLGTAYSVTTVKGFVFQSNDYRPVFGGGLSLCFNSDGSYLFLLPSATYKLNTSYGLMHLAVEASPASDTIPSGSRWIKSDDALILGTQSGTLTLATIVYHDNSIANAFTQDTAKYISTNNIQDTVETLKPKLGAGSVDLGGFLFTVTGYSENHSSIDIKGIRINSTTAQTMDILVTNFTDPLATITITNEAQDISIPFYTTSSTYIQLNFLYPDYKTETMPYPLEFTFIGERKVASENTVWTKLIPFVFNADQKYLILLTDGRGDVYKDDVLISSFINEDLDENYLEELIYTQKEDTIILTHPDMYPKMIQRLTDTYFNCVDVPLENIPYHTFSGEQIVVHTEDLTVSDVSGNIKVTASASAFTSADVGQYIDSGLRGGGRVKITSYVSATEVRGYTVIPFYSTATITGEWDLVGGYEPVWSSTRGYPISCTFYQQRLWFGGSKGKPNGVWASRVGQYSSFENANNYSNDAIDITLDSGQAEQITNIYPNRGVQIFTRSGEWVLPDNTLTPDNITAVKTTYNGSYPKVEAVAIKGVTMFIERNGKNLLGFVYNDKQASYITSSISLLASLINNPVNMTLDNNSTRNEADYLYIVNNDGTAVVACLLLDEQISSFVRHETLNGEIKDMVALGEDIYMLVKRDYATTLEKLDELLLSDNTVTRTPASDVVSELDSFNGLEVIVYDDSESYGKYTVAGGEITLTSTPVGDVYVGIPIEYQLISTKIAVNGRTDDIEKRISKATMVTKDTTTINFNGIIETSTDDRYDLYGVSDPDRDARYTITGESTRFEMLSLVLNIIYGVK